MERISEDDIPAVRHVDEDHVSVKLQLEQYVHPANLPSLVKLYCERLTLSSTPRSLQSNSLLLLTHLSSRSTSPAHHSAHA